MRIQTAFELGAFLRDLRMKRGLDQGSLAREVQCRHVLGTA